MVDEPLGGVWLTARRSGSSSPHAPPWWRPKDRIEPNDFGFSYQGNQCSSKNGSGTFLPCAQFQAALYSLVHTDPKLASIPVWGMTIVGSEPDNVGLQWLKIPHGSNTSMPDGTQYADVAKAHNYVQGRARPGKLWKTIRPFGPNP
jgi:hypothetical protein